MPYSLVINLTPISEISPSYLKGKHLHALFLTLVTSLDVELGNYLHQSQANKAFTVSPLQISHKSNRILWNHSKPIPTGVSCWFRISLLDDALFGKLSQLWLNFNPNLAWHLGAAELQVTSIFATPQSTQPWANSSTYEQLYEQSSESDRSFSFQLATPTAFRQGKYDTALPTAELVFKSLLTRWNKYSQLEIPEIQLDSLFPSFFNLHTEIVIDYRSKFIGCVGEITYRLLGQVEPLQIKYLNVLADYSLYCGIGRKNTMGMGMVRRVNS